MNRRQFIALAGFVILPLIAHAQKGKVYRVGVLWPGSPESSDARNATFRRRLRDLGYIEGKTIALIERYADGRLERLPELARELVASKVDVIVAASIAPSIAARDASNSVPIIMLHAGNPIGAGLIKSLAHPGGNVTGTTSMSEELGGKQLEILRQLVPTASRSAFIFNPTNSASEPMLKDLTIAAGKLNLELVPIEVTQVEDFGNAFAQIREARIDVLMVLIETVTGFNRQRIIDFAADARLPTLYTLSLAVRDGGLLSYGPNIDIHYEIAGNYVDKILKGAQPADLPVEQPTKFELVINLRTATALGLKVPQSLFARADEVIE
jgi:putative ABC transport system substrate-binding protein